jgi:two-component system, cell cycle sensor histidine kinase and response regulator CckA
MKRILVVDNNPVLLNLLDKLLTRQGYEVVTAEDGLSVLHILKGFKPDIIFVDLVMPNIDGEKLCKIIRSMPKLQNVALIILSGLAAEMNVDFSDWGVNACIAKGPFPAMSKRILDLLEKLDQDQQHIEKSVLGLEDVFPREITKELLSVKRHLEIILSSISEGILEINVDAKIVYANPEASSIIGQYEVELLGTDFLELFLDSDIPRVSRFLKKQGKVARIAAEEFLLVNGKEVSVNVMPIRDEKNKSIVILNDVSARKRLEADLRQAHKLEAIGTLAGGIAHDFNNLLMGIQGRTSLMLMNIDSLHPYVEHLKAIEDIVRSGSDLTRQLLGFARGGKYEVKPVDLNEIIQKSADLFGRTKKEVTIFCQCQPKLWPVEVDRGQIEQALLNLCINAWQAMPGGGELHFETENVLLDDLFVGSYQVKPGKYVKVSVKDTGVGMDEKTQTRIFEPFFTTKEMGRGTGLGLASAYGIVKGHGGIITVDSEVGKGTTFNIYLPATEKAIPREKRTSEELYMGEETILLVDDEEVITDVSKEILETLGYRVMVAASGKEAVDIYKEKKNNIDLVIMDMIMPQMSGGEAFDILRDINPEIKVILSSGYSLKGQANKIMERGCRAFLQKPFSIKELSKKVRSVLDHQEAR